MNNTNNASAEAAFMKAQDIYYDSFINTFMGMPKYAADAVNACRNWVNDLKMSQSEIRLEVQLNATGTIYQFGVTDQQSNTGNTKFNTEQRLTQQDSLVCSEYGIYLANPSSATDTTFKLCTYANPVIFTAADAALLNSTLMTNSSFAVTCNKDIVLPYRGLFNHLYLPQTQQTAALAAGSPADQLRGAEDGQITMQPNLLLIGSKGYLPQVILPTALTGLTATFARLVIIFRGVLAQNSTNIS